MKELISIPILLLSLEISLNNACFYEEKQTPRYILLQFWIAKLKYFLFLSLDSFMGETSESYPDKDESK